MAIYQVMPTELKAFAERSFGAEGIMQRMPDPVPVATSVARSVRTARIAAS